MKQTSQKSKISSIRTYDFRILTKLRSDSGFVSIFTVLIIMSVLALISIGFSTITRRAQRRTLDSQLNTQAFYAAESGVNEALVKLRADPTINKTTCQSTTDGFNYTIDAGLNVGYTCVLISTNNPSLDSTGVPLEGTAAPKIFDMKTSTGGAVSTFDVEWSASSGSALIPTTTGLTPLSGWAGNLGIVRMDITPIDVATDPNALNRDSLAKKGYSFFLYPTSNAIASSGTQTVINDSPDQGALVLVNCGASLSSCIAHMKLSGSTASLYKVRLSSIYSTVNVSIKNGVDVNGVATNWVGGQAVIDVTGKADDVFRRIQVKVPLSKNGLSSSFGLESASSICKRLNTALSPTNTSIDITGVSPADIALGVCKFN